MVYSAVCLDDHCLDGLVASKTRALNIQHLVELGLIFWLP